MNAHLPLLVALAFALFGCATRSQSPPEKQTAVVGGCYNPVPHFERFVAEHATREQVEKLMGSQAAHITNEKALRATARSEITAENMALFRRYHSATIADMECDNQVAAFFDDTGHIVGFQAM